MNILLPTFAKFIGSAAPLMIAGLTAIGAKQDGVKEFPLTSTDGLIASGIDIGADQLKGKSCVRITNPGADRVTAALVAGSKLYNGQIDFDVAARPIGGPNSTSRGFAGITFRTTDNFSRYENFFIRAANGQSTDPDRHAHAIQYQSEPGYGWPRLRAESPGVYETHANVDVSTWVHIMIQVHGRTAKFYVANAKSPSLVVSDLKLQPITGLVGLWVGPESEAWFSHLTIKPTS